MGLEDRAKQTKALQPPVPLPQVPPEPPHAATSAAEQVIGAWCKRMGITVMPSVVIDRRSVSSMMDVSWAEDCHFARGYFEVEGRRYQVGLYLNRNMELAHYPEGADQIVPYTYSWVQVEVRLKSHEKYTGRDPYYKAWSNADTLEELGESLNREL